MPLEVDIPSIEPSSTWEAVTPSDTTVLTGVTRVYVGGVGSLVVQDVHGNTTTFAVVPAGITIPISPTKIMAASTATSIVALK